MKKINVALVFGGKSAEHEISLRSAQNVIEAIDKEKYEIILIAIDKEGRWFVNLDESVDKFTFPLSLDQFPDTLAFSIDGSHSLFVPSAGNKALAIDVFFPILHGPYGEDGTIQGLFKTMQIPFVGSGVLGSSVGMDKDVMKRLLKEAGIPIGKYLAAFPDTVPEYNFVRNELGLPVYVKPASMGSSVGISRVVTAEEYEKAIEEAFAYDNKIVIEENIEGKEIECAVLGNRKPDASTVGWIKSTHEFYTYTSKYKDDKGFKLEIPAKIKPETREAIRQMAIRVFRTLEAEGLGRVDTFLKQDGSIVVNEINTMPGFTSISMYPMLWKASGLTYSQLIDKLIQLALERYASESTLRSSI